MSGLQAIGGLEPSAGVPNIISAAFPYKKQRRNLDEDTGLMGAIGGIAKMRVCLIAGALGVTRQLT
jgi:hypothetical protein